jgi:hypothetical protein
MMSFTPVVRVSRNVLKTINEFAQERELDPKLLDFELLSYETLMRSSTDEEYKVLESSQILCEDFLLDPLVSIVQEYQIRIFLKGSLRVISTINLSLASDKHRIKAVATFGVGTVLVGHKGVLKELRDALWKKKLLGGFFIDFFEANLVNQLKKLVSLIGFNKPLAKEIKFSVASGINPQPPVDAKILKIYLEYQIENNLIHPIETGTNILRYIKPKAGIDGRGCDAKYIKVREPRVIDLKPLFDETIYEVEGESENLYYAKDNGYVECENGVYKISKKLILGHASFKSSAKIDAGEERDISVHIGGKQQDFDDAIGSGVKIDVRDLNVEGSVGSNVKISANDLTIEAQTHSKSKLDVANVANIKLHKGDLHANEANIEILEIGKVTAKTIINIRQMLGGEAIAPIVRVDEVLSNCIITASELIEIGNINGAGVKLIIDPSSMESYHKQIEEIKRRLKTLSINIRLQKEEIEKDQKEHAAGVERVRKFQHKIIQAQKAGREPAKQDLIRIRQYKKTAEELKLRETKIVEAELELERLEIEQERLYKQDLHAKIVHHGVYDGHTQISFIDPKTLEKVVATPVGERETITVVIGSMGREIKMV